MLSSRNFTPLVLAILGALLVTVLATPPSIHHHLPHHPQLSHNQQQPTIIIKPPTVINPPIGSTPQTCPLPSPEMLQCIRQWACQYIIRLDLRCLLNLNGNPLLGGVLGGATSALTGAGGASSGGGGGGILGGLLGL